MEKVGILYGHLEYITIIWYILWLFGNVEAIWYIFSYFGILCQENLATLLLLLQRSALTFFHKFLINSFFVG
jgi:hypothetical protein